MTTIDAVRALRARRQATRSYRDDAIRLLELARRYRDAGCPVIASETQHYAQIAIRAARAEEVNP